MNRWIAVALAAPLCAASALAQDMPVPKLFKGMQGQKGQYQVEFLEGMSRAGKTPPTITVCTDNLLDTSRRAEKQARAESSCKHQLLKDGADEAVVESTCPERTSKVTVKRESAKSMLMTVESTGARGPQTMKMRYTHLGACREGQGAVTLDKNSEHCQKVRAQVAKMDPDKQCARQKTDRERCEQMVRDARERLLGMCS